MKNPLSNNWQAKLLAFIIALVIWTYVKGMNNPIFFDQLIHGTFVSVH